MKLKTTRVSRSTFLFYAIVFLVIVIFIFLSNRESDIPFDIGQWRADMRAELVGGLRNRMLNNLPETHVLTGLNYHQLTDLLGEPDLKEFGRVDDEKSVSYVIKKTYDVIDPDYTKDLVFTLNKDSVVDHFIVKEWHRSDE